MERVITVGGARITAEVRAGYLFLVESGRIRTLRELRDYLGEMEALMRDSGLRRALVDARDEEGGNAPDLIAAMWDWLESEHGFARVAYVLGSEITTARVNMTALSRQVPVRAFTSVPDAIAWLLRTSVRPPPSAGPA
jgi:hypothetical protein